MKHNVAMLVTRAPALWKTIWSNHFDLWPISRQVDGLARFLDWWPIDAIDAIDAMNCSFRLSDCNCRIAIVYRANEECSMAAWHPLAAWSAALVAF